MPMYQLNALHDDPENVRLVPPSKDDIEALASSMHQLGQLQPIVVRRMDDGTDDPVQYYVTIGRTRVAAARKLGWIEIEGRELDAELGPNQYNVVSAAENMVRTPMHPVDQWRALKTLTDRNMQMTTAADALGITHQYARRLDKLGRMAPAIIEALSQQPDLPSDDRLAMIASAPIDVQEAAFQRNAKRKKDIDWWDVATQCRRTHIPRAFAIFDIAIEGIDFEEDLFAEPGSPEQFTTTDVKGFLTKQAVALRERVANSKGRMMLSTIAEYSIYPDAPTGFYATHEPVPKRWKKDDPRKIAVAIVQSGHDIGKVVERVIVPKAPRKTPDGQGAMIEDEPKPRAPINMPTLAALAAMKDTAIVAGVRRCAQEWGEADDWASLLRIVMLLFAANNVTVQTSQQMYGRGSIGHVIGRLIGDLNLDQLRDAVVALVDNVIRCNYPKIVAGSGDIANVIAKLVSAEDHLPRCDTEEILKGFSGDALLALAREYGINDHGKISEVRKRMVGNMPGYKGPGFVIEPTRGEFLDDEDEDAEAEGESADVMNGGASCD
jgi:ParB family chromosome partitioning protein